MTIIRKEEAPVFTLHGLRVTGLASPRRGARETCVWRVQLAPGSPGVPHQVTREETFVALAGRAVVTMAGQEHALEPGDALVVPAHTEFAIANPAAEPFEAMVAFPVGGQAVTEQGAFTPPWAE